MVISSPNLPNLQCMKCKHMFKLSWLEKLLGAKLSCPKCGSTAISPLRF